MNVWLLDRFDDVSQPGCPLELVVVASCQSRARELAAESVEDSVWLDPVATTCSRVTDEEHVVVIARAGG